MSDLAIKHSSNYRKREIQPEEEILGKSSGSGCNRLAGFQKNTEYPVAKVSASSITLNVFSLS